MSTTHSATHYDRVARNLHWIIAALFVAAYCSVYYRHWFTTPSTPTSWKALQLHLSIGISIGVLVLLRVIWRLFSVQPEPTPGSVLAQTSAHLMHYVLYAIMIIMPLTGYLGTKVDTDYFLLFEITQFADTPLYSAWVTDGLGIDFKTFEAPIDFVHKNLGAWVVWWLILAHAAAGLYHHWILKDRTLRKMLAPK